MTDQGKANYEAYRAKAGRPGVSAEPLPEYEQLPMALQYAFDAGAGAVERWAADCPVDEDAPGNEPAKVIVVTESYAGRRLGERRYLADRYERNGNSLIIWRDGESVAEYLSGRWANVRRADAEAPDDTARALRIAVEGLELITGDQCTGDSAATLRILASERLDRIEGL